VGPFTFDVAGGACLAITGPSGSGKSRLLRMVADLDVSQGEVRLNLRARETWSGPAWRRQVGYVPAEPGWWTDRVRDHFEDPSAARLVAERLLVRPALLEDPVAQLSTGERQRLAIVRALLAAPCVLLLDEPTAALDGAATAAVEALLRERRAQGLAVVLVTHDEALAERVGTARMRIRDGQAV
jgi:putative ABC transport system ATP-binding protein